MNVCLKISFYYRNDYLQVEEPSYVLHMHPQQQGNHQSMSIPQNGYSRTQTLPHPARKHDHHHEMMVAAHNQHHQNMRPMGTHTLGRLPSHNHSPQHLPGRFIILK